MADWKPQLSYNYNPSYHAYAYGLMYQAGHEQNHGNLAGWGEAGVTELGNYNPGVTQAYYTASRSREESPPQSPEQHAVNSHGHYQGSGVVYLGDTQAGRLLLSGSHRAAYDTREKETRRAGSDSTSDSEAHTSPDSWSSGSSREGSLPQADPAMWAKKDLDDETDSGSPDAREEVSSSLIEEPQNFTITGNESTNTPSPLPVPLSTPKKTSTAANNAKGKARTAFSESQMNALVQRFNVQRYLTPAEMKNLAGLTGLTYKQVKTWFQNRRMKLRRHQKDTSWMSERYTQNKDSPNPATIFTNMPPHIQAYQGEARAQLQEQYNQQMREAAAFKKATPQNLAYYLAAVGAAGSAGYPSWSPASPQTAAGTTRPQAASWPVTPAVGHYDYNPNAFSTASGAAVATTSVHNPSCDSKNGEPAHSRSPLHMAMVHNSSQ
ncbi:homeobox protein NANOG [Centroberyx gerrardi]|uniref:homeobox protein NANOG n=1 Tax=Centroberyx gerrardi TaxID=166262 RepID=UPI003AABB72D